MKKIMIVFLFVFSGCLFGDVLITYFSRVGNTDFPAGLDTVTSASVNSENNSYSGNTEIIADFIKDKTNGDLLLIKVNELYPIDYNETLNKGLKEKNQKFRPEIISEIKDLNKYDVIFLGYPNWWSDLPMAVYAFLEENDFSGKTIIAFCTSGGSGFSNTINTIKKLQPKAKVVKGISLYDSSSMNTKRKNVYDWIDGIKELK